MANHNTQELLNALFQGLDGFVQSKTVVGEPIVVGNTTLIPLMEVSCGMASGAFMKENQKKGDGGAGAMSSKITPAAMLIIQDGRTKLIRVKNEDAFSKIIDMIPDAIDKITGGSRVTKSAEDLAEENLESLKRNNDTKAKEKISKERSATVIELPEDEDIEEIDLVDIDLTE
ncbi:GerW family sporulation protein [Oribacterium sinus]